MNKMIKRVPFAVLLAVMSLCSIAEAGLTLFTTPDHQMIILTPRRTKNGFEVLSAEKCQGARSGVGIAIYDQNKDTKPFCRVWVLAKEFWRIARSCHHGHYKNKAIGSNRAQLMILDAKLLELLNQQ